MERKTRFVTEMCIHPVRIIAGLWKHSMAGRFLESPVFKSKLQD